MAEVTLTLKGSFSNRDASVDDKPVTLAGTGAGQSAKITFSGPGEHKLKWVVTGAPGAKYAVSLAGSTDAWKAELTMIGGRDAGLKTFRVK